MDEHVKDGVQIDRGFQDFLGYLELRHRCFGPLNEEEAGQLRFVSVACGNKERRKSCCHVLDDRELLQAGILPEILASEVRPKNGSKKETETPVKVYE